jgi:hypothetical protein
MVRCNRKGVKMLKKVDREKILKQIEMREEKKKRIKKEKAKWKKEKISQIKENLINDIELNFDLFEEAFDAPRGKPTWILRS